MSEHDPHPHGDADAVARCRESLSRLMDGDASVADDACRAFRDNAQARADWHAYHLVGDLLRNGDLERPPSADARFVRALRERLAEVPVVRPAVRPIAQPSASRAAARWFAPAAVAAGFVAVAGVLVVTRMAAPSAADGRMALASGMQRPAASASVAASPASDMVLIRNPDLDRYLAAHRDFASTSTLAAPGGVVRSATVVAPDR